MYSISFPIKKHFLLYISINFLFDISLYNSKNLIVEDCRFEGPEDGESALKECSNIKLNNCYMDLRYPFWHDNLVSINNVEMTKNCRAALWYSKDISITNSTLGGIKALRECSDVTIYNSYIDSAEFGWKTKKLTINNTTLSGEYAFFECKDVYIDKIDNFDYTIESSASIVDDGILNVEKLSFEEVVNVSIFFDT